MKKSSRKKITILDIVLWLAIAGVVISAGVLGWKLWGYRQGQKTYQDIEEVYTVKKEPQQADEPEETVIDMQKLHEEYPDAIGWLEIDALGISYPILQGPDNAYYLYRLPDKTYNASGSLFLDYANEGWNNLHTLVYGHNMRDGSMLAGILKYMDASFYQENGGEVLLHTLDGVWKYEMISIAQVAPDSEIYTLGFGDDENYWNFMEQIKALSAYDTGVQLVKGSPIMTLSTCTKDGKNRIVLSAMRTEKVEG